MLLRTFFGGPHKLSGHTVRPHGLGLISRQRSEFKLRFSGRGIPVRVPRRSVRSRPWDSTRAAAVRRNLFQVCFRRASDDEAMMGRILAGLGAVVARICDILARRNTEDTQQHTAAKHLRKRADMPKHGHTMSKHGQNVSKNAQDMSKHSQNTSKVGWVNSGPPPLPLPLPLIKNRTGIAPERRLPLVSQGLDCQVCIDRQASRCL